MINWRSTESTDLQYSGTSLWSSLGQSREAAGGSLYEVELAEHINSYLKTSSQSLVLAGRSALDVGTALIHRLSSAGPTLPCCLFFLSVPPAAAA